MCMCTHVHTCTIKFCISTTMQGSILQNDIMLGGALEDVNEELCTHKK